MNDSNNYLKIECGVEENIIEIEIKNAVFDTAGSRVSMVYDTKRNYLSKLFVYSHLGDIHQSTKKWEDLVSYGQCMLVIEDLNTLSELADSIKDEKWLRIIDDCKETPFENKSIKQAVLKRLHNAGADLADFVAERLKEGGFDDITDSEGWTNLWEFTHRLKVTYNIGIPIALMKDLPNVDSRFLIKEPDIETGRYSNGEPWTRRDIDKYCIYFMERTDMADWDFGHTTDHNAIICAYYGKDKEVIIPQEFNGNPVKSIAPGAFHNCKELVRVFIPDSVTRISSYAFSGCASLTSVDIPDGVKEIDCGAFSDCASLKRVTIPDSVTRICGGVFKGCTSLKSVDIPDGVEEIGCEAFSDCISLARVTIPDSVTEISSYAFSSCTSLARVTIPDSVTKIGYSAFEGCASLTSVTIPNSVIEICPGTFENCTSLKSVTIPRVKRIGHSAFRGCSSLADVTIKSVTKIEKRAFYDCSSLTDVTLPKSVTEIGGWAFKGCTSLASVTVPDSVAKIGDGAFYECTSLASVTIPDSVTKIGARTFDGCTCTVTYKGKGSCFM